MKKLLLFIFCLQFSFGSWAQKDHQVLLKIDDEKVTIKDFKEVYEKNLGLVEASDEKDLDRNLELFINYKLKVKEAYRLQFDTLKTYKREIQTYRNQLYAPYLKDQDILDSLISQAYQRSTEEIRGSHILVRLAKDATPNDTLKAYQKIMSAREKIVNGIAFDIVAKEFSEDRSVINNGGDLGYFSAFKMVKEFEDAAFVTKVDEVSKPFKTQFGYHIIKVVDRRPSRGERQVAHILITGDKKTGKQRIDSIYKVLNSGSKFEDVAKAVSNDIGSKEKGGLLPKFSSGRMIPVFDSIAFALKEKNELSQPFETRYGWHLIKLMNVYPVLSFEESKSDLEDKLKKSGRYSLSRKAMIEKLKKSYEITENLEAKKIFSNQQLRGLPKDSLQLELFSINDATYNQDDFISYIKNRRHKSVPALYEMFLDEKVLDFYKENLVNEEPEFAKTLKEYQEGLLLFELMQKKVWEKSTDSTKLTNFFKEKKANYNKPLDSIKGLVINDFQKSIEANWMARLREESNIDVNKRLFRKLKKSYARRRSQ